MKYHKKVFTDKNIKANNVLPEGWMEKKRNILEHPGDGNVTEINKRTESRSASPKLRIKSIETAADE